jgi:hypothetical protein
MVQVCFPEGRGLTRRRRWMPGRLAQLFSGDEFDGPAGSTRDPTRWTRLAEFLYAHKQFGVASTPPPVDIAFAESAQRDDGQR